MLWTLPLNLTLEAFVVDQINALYDMLPDANVNVEYVKNLLMIIWHTLFPVVNEVHGVSLAKG